MECFKLTFYLHEYSYKEHNDKWFLNIPAKWLQIDEELLTIISMNTQEMKITSKS